MDLRNFQWIIIAQRDGICKETGRLIKAGEQILYIPAFKKGNIPARIFCQESKTYKESLDDIRTGWKIPE